MSQATRRAINWVEQGLVPDAVVRAGIRRLCEQRLREIAADDCERAADATEERAPVAHVLEHLDRHDTIVPAGSGEQVHVGRDHLDVRQVAPACLGLDPGALRR